MQQGSSNAGVQRKYNHLRSRKVCEHCHSRKIRCNIVDSGIPCANCTSYGKKCVVRRRKNQRRDATPSDDDQGATNHSRTASNTNDTVSAMPSTLSLPGESHSSGATSNPDSTESHAKDAQPGNWWTPSQQDQLELMMEPMSADCDFSHLMDMDDIFTFTGNVPHTIPNFGEQTNVATDSGTSSAPARYLAGIRPDDQGYLHQQGCFSLPPATTLHELMLLYFRWVHSHLPIVDEHQFWTILNGEQLGDFPLLLLRAMLFAAVGYADLTLLSNLGFTSKRGARSTLYRQAKLLFDLGAEKDPVTLTQTCLLLTYQSPSYTRLRVNTSWLIQAIRFTKVARADAYQRFAKTEPARARLLKRLWWSVVFRDCILSLGTRRSPQIDYTSDTLRNLDGNILQADDFLSELGCSPVHDTETQLRVVELLGATCRLMPRLAKANKILYTPEGIDDRVALITDVRSPSLIQSIQHSLESLQIWHDETISRFPFPVSLEGDDVPEAICLYCNMLFVYHAAATFGLNVYLVLIYEMVSASRSLFDIEDCREALETANSDLSRRTQELLQIRLIKNLPISATPLIAPPLILQSINVAAARSQASLSHLEAVELRKLDIFTRTLKSQQERFEGADYCVDVLNNIIAYASDDEKFIASMSSWQERRSGPGRRASMVEGSPVGQTGSVKLDWGNLIYKRPRLFLRLMLHLDHSLCTGGPPEEMDFPSTLRREVV